MVELPTVALSTQGLAVTLTGSARLWNVGSRCPINRIGVFGQYFLQFRSWASVLFVLKAPYTIGRTREGSPLLGNLWTSLYCLCYTFRSFIGDLKELYS
jgi:hypothetical protein